MSDRDATSPSHYTRLAPDPLDVITAWGLDFLAGNVVKYLARAGHKLDTPALVDLEKARVYLDRAVVEAGGESLLRQVASLDIEAAALRVLQDETARDLSAALDRVALLAATAKAAGDRIRELEAEVAAIRGWRRTMTHAPANLSGPEDSDVFGGEG